MTTPRPTRDTLTPAERHMITLYKRGYTDEVVAHTFDVKVHEIREMKAAAEKKLEAAQVPAREEYWDK